MKQKRIILSVIAGMTLIAFSGCSKKNYSQDDFSKKVLMKPTWVVYLTVGKPDEVNKEKDQQTWVYKGRTFDPKTSKTDRAAWLTVKKGKIVQTGY
jgi:hypothetical protein